MYAQAEIDAYVLCMNVAFLCWRTQQKHSYNDVTIWFLMMSVGQECCHAPMRGGVMVSQWRIMRVQHGHIWNCEPTQLNGWNKSTIPSRVASITPVAINMHVSLVVECYLPKNTRICVRILLPGDVRTFCLWNQHKCVRHMNASGDRKKSGKDASFNICEI